MTATTKLDLELLQNGAANQTLSNETFHQLNQLVQAAVVDRATTPPGSPANEALYLIIATATGIWAGKENQLAYWLTSTNAWQYVTPREGMLVHVNDEDEYYSYDGSAWAIFSSGGGGVSLPVVQALSSTRNLALVDNNTFNVNSTTNNYTVTILPQSSVAWTADFESHFLPSNTGDIVITGGTGVSINGVVAGSVTLSTQNGAASIKRIGSDSWWIGGVIGSAPDMLSTLGNSEVSVTGAVTLDATAFGKLHTCVGTSADYTVTLPAVSGNTGKFIGFRMSSALTKLVTLDASGSELIDGSQTRVMWANETATLYCDGSTWVKVAGKSIPMTCEMYPTTAISIASTTVTKVPLEFTVLDNTGALADSATNKRVNIKRTGIYRAQAVVYFQPGTQVMAFTQTRIHVNGSVAALGANTQTIDVPATDGYFNQHAAELTVSGGSYIELYAYHDSISAAARDLYVNDATYSYLAISEKITW